MIILVRSLLVAILLLVGMTGWRCLEGHWCMDGHNRHGQLLHPGELGNDIVLSAAMLAFPATALFNRRNVRPICLVFIAGVLSAPLFAELSFAAIPVILWLVFVPRRRDAAAGRTP